MCVSLTGGDASSVGQPVEKSSMLQRWLYYIVGFLVVSLGTLRHVAAKQITQYNAVMVRGQSYLARDDYIVLLIQTTRE